MGQSISLQLTRNLSIAPALQKSLQLLQMNALEFEQEISQALDSNPLLEMEEGAEALDEFGSADAVGDAQDEIEIDQRLDDTNDVAAMETMHDLDVEYGDASAVDAYDNLSSDDMSSYENFGDDAGADAGIVADSDQPREATTEQSEAAGDEFNEHLTDWSTSPKSAPGEGLSALDLTPSQGSLRDHLLQQLGSLRINRLDQQLCMLVIDSLDPAGYLREDLEELASLAKGLAGDGGKVTVGPEELRIALSHVQSFDPPGVAARTLEECLALQLRAVPVEVAGKSTALVIVENHLHLLARNDFRGIAAASGASDSELSAATRLIRSLDPKPGLGFGKDRVVFAVPEVIVKKVKGKWTAALHPAATPRVRINAEYASIVTRNEGGQCKGLSAQLQEAKWLMRSIEQRANTIEKTAAAIVARQQAFFDHGDIGLQPLKLADIAADVGIHESTVSRVVNSKYLQCPAGLIPMRKFFTSHVETSAGDACSATAVKAMIRQLVSSETAVDPLSDHRLAKMLTQRGIRIARRTVTKYRDALGIEAADRRRQLNQPTAADLAKADPVERKSGTFKSAKAPARRPSVPAKRQTPDPQSAQA